jgi:hypothetical protein
MFAAHRLLEKTRIGIFTTSGKASALLVVVPQAHLFASLHKQRDSF